MAVPVLVDQDFGGVTRPINLPDPSANQHAATRAYADTKLPLAGGTMAGPLSLASDPSSALHAATKQYVDGIAANLGKRMRVRAATTANITIATALNNNDTLDGITLATGDYVLVKNQSTPAQNGLYEVGASPARVAEFDTYDEHPGTLIAVAEGTTNADTIWLCTSNQGGTLNTTAITFTAILVLVANSVTDAFLRDSAALSVIGRSANSSGDPADIAAGTDGHVLRRAGTVLGFGLLAAVSRPDRPGCSGSAPPPQPGRSR
jgi:hypothetical protein